MHERVKILTESVSSSYQASLQIYWTPAMLQEYIIITSLSSNESKDEDEFFEQDHRRIIGAFMILIWKEIK